MAFNWILIGVILLLVFLLLKAKEVRHKVATIVIIALLVFLVFTFSQVASQPGVDFKSFDGILSAGKLYLLWLKHVFVNIATITGNAVNLDWGVNFTNSTK